MGAAGGKRVSIAGFSEPCSQVVRLSRKISGEPEWTKIELDQHAYLVSYAKPPLVTDPV
jgi:hypothetical protein